MNYADIPNISLLQIHTFLLVVEMGGFAKAGLELHLSQPAVSKNIAKLENELDLKLFKRTTRKINLTSEGEKLYNYWNQTSREGLKLIQTLRHHQILEEKEINIAITNTTLAGKYLWEYVELFNRIHPEVVINIDSDSMHVITAKLSDGEYDIVIVPDFQSRTLEKNGLSWAWVKKENVKLLIPNTNPLSRKEYLHMSDLLNETFVTLNEIEAPEYNSFLHSLFAPYGKIPNISTIYRSDNAVRSVYRGLDGIFITDDFFDYDYTSDVSKVSLSGHKNGVICAWKDNPRSKYISEFLQILKH